MLALSVRAPWWFAILHMCKDIGKRDWVTSFRGRILVHASKWWNKDKIQEDLGDALYVMESRGLRLSTFGLLDLTAMRASGGAIVGAVDIVDCVEQSRSPWFYGRYGFLLANPVALAKPVPCPGSLKLFPVPEPIANRAVTELLLGAGKYGVADLKKPESARILTD